MHITMDLRFEVFKEQKFMLSYLLQLAPLAILSL